MFPTALKPATVIENCSRQISHSISEFYSKIALWHWCSPVNFLLIFRTPFCKNTYGGLLLLKFKFLEDWNFSCIVMVREWVVKEIIWKISVGERGWNEFFNYLPCVIRYGEYFYNKKNKELPGLANIFGCITGSANKPLPAY